MIYQITDSIIPNEELVYDISAPENCGRLIVKLNRNLFGYEARELPAIVIRFMSKIDGDLIQIDNHVYVWNSHEDFSFNVFHIPSSVTILVEPVIDESYIKYSKINPSKSFPISIMFDNSDIAAEVNFGCNCSGDHTSGGSGGTVILPDGSYEIYSNINSISMAGQELNIDNNKNVDIPVATNNNFGVIKGSNLSNKIGIDALGQLEINNITLDRVSQNGDIPLIINCGNSIDIN